MSVKDLPAGYTVACIEGKWYPLQARLRYGIDDPDGYPDLTPLLSFPQLEALSFSTQRNAILKCQEEAQEEEVQERENWERLTVKSDAYPERCAYYMDVIEQARGHVPIVYRYSFIPEVSVSVPGHYCSTCKQADWGFSVKALTIENALKEAAERVYTERCQCERVQWEELQSTPSYVERFADGRVRFETDDMNLLVGEQKR
jgi:hypothetical protein